MLAQLFVAILHILSRPPLYAAAFFIDLFLLSVIPQSLPHAAYLFVVQLSYLMAFPSTPVSCLWALYYEEFFIFYLFYSIPLLSLCERFAGRVSRQNFSWVFTDATNSLTPPLFLPLKIILPRFYHTFRYEYDRFFVLWCSMHSFFSVNFRPFSAYSILLPDQLVDRLSSASFRFCHCPRYF